MDCCYRGCPGWDCCCDKEILAITKKGCLAFLFLLVAEEIFPVTVVFCCSEERLVELLLGTAKFDTQYLV